MVMVVQGTDTDVTPTPSAEPMENPLVTQIKLEGAAITTTRSQDAKHLPADHVDTAATSTIQAPAADTAAAVTTQAPGSDAVDSAAAASTDSVDTAPLSIKPEALSDSAEADRLKPVSQGTEKESIKVEPSAEAPTAAPQVQAAPAAIEAGLKAAAPVREIKSEVVVANEPPAVAITPPSAANSASLPQPQAVVKQEPMETS